MTALSVRVQGILRRTAEGRPLRLLLYTPLWTPHLEQRLFQRDTRDASMTTSAVVNYPATRTRARTCRIPDVHPPVSLVVSMFRERKMAVSQSGILSATWTCLILPFLQTLASAEPLCHILSWVTALVQRGVPVLSTKSAALPARSLSIMLPF